MTENYLSGKKRSLKLGVSGHSENLTSLQTVGGVGIGTTNADKRALYVVGNTEIVGVLTAASYSGDGSGLTGVAATDHVASFDLQVAGISTFYDDVRVVRGGIDVSAGVVSATQLDIGTGGIDVDGQADLDELVVAGVSTFSKAIDLNAGIDVDGQADLDEVVVAGAATFTNSLKVDGAVDIGTGGLDVDGETQLDELVVAGVSTFSGNIVAATAEFSGNVTIGGTLTVEDKTNVDSVGLITARTGVRVTAGGIDVTAGVSTFSDTVKLNGTVDIGTGGVDIDGQTDLDEVVIAGVTTFNQADIIVNTAVGTAITIHAGNIQSVGIITADKFVGDGSGLANLPGINTEATSVFTDITVTGGANITGVVTAGSYRGDGSNLTGIGTQGPNVSAFGLSVQGISTFHDDVRITAGGINAVGVITATSFVGDGSQLTNAGVDTATVSTNNLQVLGVSTFSDDVRITAGGLDVAGVGTFTGIYVKDDSGNNDVIIDNNYVSNHVYISLKDNCKAQFGNGTDLQIYHDASNSYVIDQGVGDLILGANDNVKITNGAGTENKIVAITDGSVDLYYDNVKKFTTTAVGATVYGNSKATTLHIAGISTLTGDVNFAGNLKNVNATGISSFIQLDVSTGGIDVDGQADLDEVVVAGAATFSNTVKIDGALDIGTGGVDIDGQTDLDELVVAGVSTFSKNIDLNAGLDVDGQADLDEVVVAGAATFSSSVKIDGAVDIGTGGVDIDGQTDLDELVVAGVSTFSAKAVFNTAYPSIDADNEIQVGTAIQLGKAGVITATSFSGSGANLTGIAATDHVSTFDLVVAGVSTFYNDVKIVGGGSTAGNQITIGATTLNDGTLTFDGTAGQLFSISNNLTDGSIFSVNDVSGMPSIDVGAAGTIQLAPYGAGELVGIGTTRPTSKLDVVGDVQVVGVVTATSFSGSGANLTGITITDGSFIGLNVTGVSTLSGEVQVGSALTVTAGISTFNNDVIFDGAYNITWDKSQNQLIFDDNAKLAVGSGNPATSGGDFFIWSDGSEVYFDGNTNLGYPDIIFRPHNGSGRPALKLTNTGSAEEVQLYYTGANKLTTKTDGVGVSGILTASGINLAAGSGIEAGATGILTAVQVDVSTGGLDVDGQTDLDEVVVAGVTTFNGQTKFKAHATWDDSDEAKFGDSGDLRIYHTTSGSYIQEDSGSGHLNIGGSQVLIRDANIAGHYASFAEPTSGISGILTATGINLVAGSGRQLGATGILTAVQVDVSTGGLDVDGLTDLDEVVVAGASTFSYAVDINAGLDVDGQTDLDELRVAGVTTFLQGDIYFPDDTYFRSDEEFHIRIKPDKEFRVSGNNTNQPYITANANGDVALFHCANGNGSKKVFETTGSGNIGFGATIYGNLHVTSGGSSWEATNGAGIITCSDFNARGANITGVLTCVNPSFTNVSAIGGNYTGVVTASSFSGDGSALTGIEAGGTGDFYVGFTSSVTMNAASYEATGHTFASTTGKTYTIDSIMASNVANVGVGTTVNLIASISSNSGVAAGTTEQTYFAYNIPIAAGGAIELIKEPFVANPNDIVKLWATDSTYTGISSAIQVHMTYTQQDSTDFFGKYAANTSIGSTTIIGIHTAGTTKAATIQSVHITNRSDAGPFPVDIMMTDSTGIVTTYLVKNLVIPKYSAVEILERPKRMEIGSSLGVKVQQTGTIDVIVSGKTYS